MECWFIDLKQLIANKLAQESQQHALIAVFVDHRYNVLGELTHRLKLPLTDILLGHASIEKMDIVVLTFSEYNEARDIFLKIPENWTVEGQSVMSQLWYRGQIQEQKS